MQARRPLVAAALIASACGSTQETPGPELPAAIEGVHRYELDAPGVTGLSDITRDGQGRLWAVAERSRSILRVDRPGARPVLLPIEGVPDGIDIEGLAWLEGERFALATESNAGLRGSDGLYLAAVADDILRVESQRDLSYDLWKLQAVGNQGVEGLCRAGGELVLAIESVIASGADRFAPIAVNDVATGAWTAHRVRLTTRTGKISALACVPVPGRAGAIDVLAVERHFEVARLLRFTVPPGRGDRAPTHVLEPVVAVDLGPLLTHQENFEGLVWQGGRDFALVVDNDWTQVTGPNLLVTARLGADPPSAP
ncbi:MAG TPA: esterase-like activity of phytase family protein [Kofleriaceae bacterium]|nr:esterase-like activity of phytase family protein [Kofleriaceae bacterium]